MQSRSVDLDRSELNYLVHVDTGNQEIDVTELAFEAKSYKDHAWLDASNTKFLFQVYCL